MGESVTSERRLVAVDRQVEALNLRRAGWTYREIASELGYGGPSGAYKAIQAALEQTIREPADALRAVEAERLDALQSAVWPDAMRGKLSAIDRVLKVMERRARLFGLDAPQKTATFQFDMVAEAKKFAREQGLSEQETNDLIHEVRAVLVDSGAKRNELGQWGL